MTTSLALGHRGLSFPTYLDTRLMEAFCFPTWLYTFQDPNPSLQLGQAFTLGRSNRAAMPAGKHTAATVAQLRPQHQNGSVFSGNCGTS
jgi:hypothetical protein